MRSLILAGGGLKVAYQAGCLQVLLDELELEFDHVDAASGGCFNAAMMASGMTGTEIANAWRDTGALTFTTLNVNEYVKGPWLRSIGTADGIHKAFARWKIDFNAINNQTARTYTFNCFNFTKKRVFSIDSRDLDKDYLTACVSLPIWFAPVYKNGDWLFDAVFCTDGNVGKAVSMGADEIWVIWTVSDLPDYRDGLVAQYFHIIETVGNARFNDEWDEISAVNEAIRAYGQDPSRAVTDLRLREGFLPASPALAPPPGRKIIRQHLIKQEVPVHYVLTASQDRYDRAVEMGIRDAREYARQHVDGRFHGASFAAPEPIYLEFSETMRGFFMPGEEDCLEGERRGRVAGNRIRLRLRISTNNLDSLLNGPDHECHAEGVVDAPFLHSKPMKAIGHFNLFVDDTDPGSVPPRTLPASKTMRYSVRFTDSRGAQYTLEGVKYVNARRGFTPWRDTTTCFIRILIDVGGSPQAYACGIVHVLLPDFLEELTTFRARKGKNPCKNAEAIARFGKVFFGNLWDVYLRQILDYGPV